MRLGEREGRRDGGERRSDGSGGVSGRHAEGETDRAERTAKGKRETEQEAMVRGREGGSGGGEMDGGAKTDAASQLRTDR